MSKTDWTEIADMICQVLHKIYVESREYFEQYGREIDATLEQLAAMAITQLFEERFGGKRPGNGKQQGK